jgi:selenide,water dikinase
MANLVLIGGGHSHAIALKELGKLPANQRPNITLITNVELTPYSGMLPGYIAGLYSFADCHINLTNLTNWAGVNMIVDEAIALDLGKNQVICRKHQPVNFDLLSIDIGSTPNSHDIPGVDEYTIPVKPITQFCQNWQNILEEIKTSNNRQIRIAVIGGGAGGVELALAISGRLQQINKLQQLSPNYIELHLFQKNQRLLPERHSSVSQICQKVLFDQGIKLHLGCNIFLIKQEYHGRKTITLKLFNRPMNNFNYSDFDYIFWVTQASASPWLKTSGLATNDQGFILVNDYLQSVSHPQIFAAGDIANMVNHPRPKAGVFAVRQGLPLFNNLLNRLNNEPLIPFIPQKEFLILIGTGDQRAIASKGSLTMGPHPWLWRMKDYIDWQFMNQFINLI